MKTTTILKFSIILFAAMLSVSAAAQNFSRYMASAPQAHQPAVVSPMAHQPMAKDPSANQPVVSVRDYQRPATHVSVNGNFRKVTPVAQNSYRAAYAPAAPARRGGVLGGGSASASGSSFGSTASGTTNRPNVNVAGLSTGSTIVWHGGDGEDEDFGSEDKDSGEDVKPSDDPAIGETRVPIGSSLIPLLLMLLCYALFRLVRGDVREEQEMA